MPLDLGGGDPLPRDRVVIVALDTRKVVAQRDVPAGAAPYFSMVLVARPGDG